MLTASTTSFWDYFVAEQQRPAPSTPLTQPLTETTPGPLTGTGRRSVRNARKQKLDSEDSVDATADVKLLQERLTVAAAKLAAQATAAGAKAAHTRTLHKDAMAAKNQEIKQQIKLLKEAAVEKEKTQKIAFDAAMSSKVGSLNARITELEAQLETAHMMHGARPTPPLNAGSQAVCRAE